MVKLVSSAPFQRERTLCLIKQIVFIFTLILHLEYTTQGYFNLNLFRHVIAECRWSVRHVRVLQVKSCFNVEYQNTDNTMLYKDKTNHETKYTFSVLYGGDSPCVSIKRFKILLQYLWRYRSLLHKKMIIKKLYPIKFDKIKDVTTWYQKLYTIHRKISYFL